MKLLVKNDEKNKLILEASGQTYLIETKLRQREKQLFFAVEKIEDANDRIKVTWSHEELGVIYQTFSASSPKRKHKNCSEIELGFFEINFIPKENVEGIIDQTIGFKPLDEPYFMIPGHIYNNNNIKNAKSVQPQLNYRGDIAYPKTPVIYTRADRSTHNAVIAMTGHKMIGVRINETVKEMCTMITSHNKDLAYLYNGLGIDTRHVDQYDRIAITLGYHHFPVHYYGKLGPNSYSDSDELHMIHFGKNIEYQVDGHFYIANINSRFAYEDVIEYFYEEIHVHPGNEVDRLGAIKDMMKALSKDAYNKKYHYFPTVLSGALPDTGLSGDTAWTGGMQVAYPMIKASKYAPNHIDVPIDFIDHLIATGFNEKANMFYESKKGNDWYPSGWWTNNLHLFDECFNRITFGHSAYVNGQAVTYLLKSYQFLTEHDDLLDGKNIDAWLDPAKRIVDHVIKHMRYDGALGVYYNPNNGQALYYNSFQGVWFLAAIAEIYKISKAPKYKKAFDKANKFYWRFMERLELWGMPMDIEDAVDEEGNLAYITALKTMHEVTHERKLLDTLIHCFHYEFSWKFAYNTVHVNEPLKTLNWPSCGGSITSSHNIHIHQMGNLVCEEMHYVYEHTNNLYILSRLKDTLNWGLGTHNSEQYDFGFGSRGWATEQFFHTDGKQDDNGRIVDGGIWYDYLSWAAACCLLSSSLDIADDLYKA